MHKISINFKIYDEEEAKISISDLAIQRGFGIFDFLKMVNNKPIFLDDYLSRFFNSAKEMNIKVNFSRQQLKDSIKALIAENNMPNCGIKIILTGGFSADGYTIGKPNLIINQTPFEMNRNFAEKGLALVSYNHQRQIPEVKTIDYLQAIRLQNFIKENNANDLLYHNNGEIRECPRANFFMVTDNEIITPKSQILSGITRSKILNFQIANYTFSERDFTLEDVYQAKEAFVSSSTKNAYPISLVDGKAIGDGNNQITKLIHANLLKLIDAEQGN